MTQGKPVNTGSKQWLKLASSGVLSPLDVRFGAWCRRRSGGDELVAVSAALVSAQRAQGHSCVDLRLLADKVFPHEEPKPGRELDLPHLPKLDAWRRALLDCPLVGDGTAPTPLVLQGDRLYLYRYLKAERRIARFIFDRMDRRSLDGADNLKQLFRRQFPSPTHEIDWQAAAALAALQRDFCIVTGGPGTGKTTTVIKILALLLGREPQLRIALAAPTGKAASRLSESIKEKVNSLDVDEALRRRIPVEVATLHRLLGYQPLRDGFRYNSRRPLPYDMVVVDEASMVDLLMMDNLMQALAPRCRLLLIGDHEQLASVDTGFVLGDITSAAAVDQAHGVDFARVYRNFTAQDMPGQEEPPPLRDAAVFLRKSYRFGEDSGIGELSRGIRCKDPGRSMEVLHAQRFPDVTYATPPPSVRESLDPIMDQLLRYMRSTTPQEFLARFAEGQVLCGLRNGTWGVENLNAAVERRMIEAGYTLSSTFYRGRPILITQNDYQTRLFNGDIGVCMNTPQGTRAFFPDPDGGEPRHLPVSRLPAHETAWAMTVHKNQGSEFDRVLLFLPDAGHPLCCRELFYTGVTRARNSLHVIADERAVRASVTHGSVRTGGLTGLLSRGRTNP